LISHLTDGVVFLCTAPGVALETPTAGKIRREEFDGPHPAGLAGTHIHFLDPVSVAKTVWTIGYQDVIAIARLFRTGKLDTTRVVALAGPQVVRPRLLRTRLGADLQQLVGGELKEGVSRIISGSGFTSEEHTSELQSRESLVCRLLLEKKTTYRH